MHIAMVAPPWFNVPPDAYGGIEEVVSGLVHELTGREHRVTLIGAGAWAMQSMGAGDIRTRRRSGSATRYRRWCTRPPRRN